MLCVFIRTTEPGFPLRDVDLLFLYLSVLETARVPVALIQLPTVSAKEEVDNSSTALLQLFVSSQ